MSTQVSTRKTIKSLTKMPIALYFPGKKTAEDESAGLSKQYNMNKKDIHPAQ